MDKPILQRIQQYLVETGYDESQREHWKLLAAAAEEIAGLQAFKRSVDEALNSGNGTYKP